MKLIVTAFVALFLFTPPWLAAAQDSSRASSVGLTVSFHPYPEDPTVTGAQGQVIPASTATPSTGSTVDDWMKAYCDVNQVDCTLKGKVGTMSFHPYPEDGPTVVTGAQGQK